MSNCSNHKKEVAGISDMKVLAEMIGDLHYEALANFLNELSLKLYKDSIKDFQAGKIRLSEELSKASNRITESYFNINEAWQISKKFMEDKTALK